MDPKPEHNRRTAEDVYSDFSGRRVALIKALTIEFDDFYAQCDPENDNLCLYGLPSEEWEVTLPAEDVPPELPEPALGINFSRDGMDANDWLALVAVHSDAWLLAVAFYFASRFGFDKADRYRLFSLINDLPTILEVVSGSPKNQVQEIIIVSNFSSSKSKSNFKSTKYAALPSQPEEEEVSEEEEEGEGESEDEGEDKAEDEEDEGEDKAEDEEEQEDTFCGACGRIYTPDEFWICCDMCEIWYHGRCVKVTPSRAEHINKYKCPFCNIKRARV